MNIQNYLLCTLYIFLIIAHSFTLCQKDFHRGLISIFSFALITEAISTLLFTLYQAVFYGEQLTDITDINLSLVYNVQYLAQFIHITSINFFILFLLIIARGWPITRSDMPFRNAFAIFWLLCLAADLLTFYWTTTVVAKDFINSTTPASKTNSSLSQTNTISSVTWSDLSTTGSSNSSVIDSMPSDIEQFNSTPRRLSLLLRIVIMIYFLLELRTTMILEQEKKKLQFYLHFGAFSMVWFVHSLIVYFISLRVEIVWQSKLISGFTSAANFLAFAVTTRLLWPKGSRSYLFRKSKRGQAGLYDESGAENFSDLNNEDGDYDDYDGLEMRDLSDQMPMTKNNNSNENTPSKTREIPSIRVDTD